MENDDKTSDNGKVVEQVTAPEPTLKTPEELNQKPAEVIDPSLVEEMGASAPFDLEGAKAEYGRLAETASRMGIDPTPSQDTNSDEGKMETAKALSTEAFGSLNVGFANWLVEHKL